MISVFVADDEPWSIMALKGIIDWVEHDFVICGEAEDGKQALARILRMKPDLVISDIRMPEMDGLALIKALREQNMDTQVLLLSGYSDFEYAREALKLGCLGYLVKPVDEKELLSYLETVKKKIERRRMQEKAIQNDNEEQSKQEKANEEQYVSERILVSDMVEYIKEHYKESLSLQILSEEFGLNESYISSLIKKRTGKKFGEHLVEIRVNKAQELLRTTNMTIEEIASDIGIPDYYYFIKVYKKATGLSPAAYRKQL